MRDDSHFKSREGAATFEEYNVSPAVVQLADLFALADLAESAGFVEGDTGVVFQEDSRLEGFAVASAASRGRDVDGDFCDSGIDLAGGDRTEGGPGNDGVFSARDQTRVRVVAGIPSFPAGRAGLEGGVAGSDAFAIDGFDGGPVVGLHGNDGKAHVGTA